MPTQTKVAPVAKVAATGTNSLSNYNAGFYNAFISALNLSASEFQLTQGAFALPSVSTSLYNVFDGVPPVSVCDLYTANDINTFSGNVQQLLGYADQNEQSQFTYKIASNNYMNAANWVNGSIGTNPIYAPTTAAIQQALSQNGSTQTFTYNSATANTSLSNAWTQSSSSGGVWFWGYNNDSTSQTINTLATSSDVSVTMTLTYVTVPIQAGGWYSSGYFVQMYQNPSDWSGGQSQWNTMFGPAGSLQYISTQALIVTNFTISVTSSATYSASQYNYISNSSNVNVWPFYTSSSTSATTTSYKQNADNTITATIHSIPNAVQIMGFNVSSTQSLVEG